MMVSKQAVRMWVLATVMAGIWAGGYLANQRPVHAQQIYAPQVYNETLTATQANDPVTFTADSVEFAARYILVVNRDATNEVFVSLDNTGIAVATGTPYVEILAGESLSFTFATDNGPSKVGLICSAAETADVQIVGMR